jgi:glycolate oxidase iron-sulfur subunit
LRWLIAETMTRPSRVSLALTLARLFAPIATRLPGKIGAMGRKGARLSRGFTQAAPNKAEPNAPCVAIMGGCVQAAAAPEIDQALSRALSRQGYASDCLEGCCGSLAHHLGYTKKARAAAMRVIEAFERASRDRHIEAVVISATGCAAHLKDYPYLFKGDPHWGARAQKFAARVRDVSEVTGQSHGRAPRALRVAFHSACSAQNGLKLKREVETSLARAGYEVIAIPEGHLCCGSAGSYSLLQPDIAGELRSRKLSNIASTSPHVVATGNIGCILHLSGSDAPPIVHYVELLDWAEGGPLPFALHATVDEMERAR